MFLWPLKTIHMGIGMSNICKKLFTLFFCTYIHFKIIHLTFILFIYYYYDYKYILVWKLCGPFGWSYYVYNIVSNQ